MRPVGMLSCVVLYVEHETIGPVFFRIKAIGYTVIVVWREFAGVNLQFGVTDAEVIIDGYSRTYHQCFRDFLIYFLEDADVIEFYRINGFIIIKGILIDAQSFPVSLSGVGPQSVIKQNHLGDLRISLEIPGVVFCEYIVPELDIDDPFGGNKAGEGAGT
jgi:hypothetical protein